MEDLTQNMKYYNYYFNAYSAVLNRFIGNYSIETEMKMEQLILKQYGLKHFYLCKKL